MTQDFDEQMRRAVKRLASEVDLAGVLPRVATRMRRRRAVRRIQLAALTLAMVAGTGAGTWGLARTVQERQVMAPPATSRPAERLAPVPVATVDLGGDLRVVLTARPGSDHGGGAPRATVTLTAYRAAGGGWQPAGERILGRPDSWAWQVVSGPAAVCELTAGHAKPQRITVSLVANPPAGCSPPYRFHLEGGRLASG